MKLEKYLVLNKYLLSLFGANSMMNLDLIVLDKSKKCG